MQFMALFSSMNILLYKSIVLRQPSSEVDNHLSNVYGNFNISEQDSKDFDIFAM